MTCRASNIYFFLKFGQMSTHRPSNARNAKDQSGGKNRNQPKFQIPWIPINAGSETCRSRIMPSSNEGAKTSKPINGSLIRPWRAQKKIVEIALWFDTQRGSFFTFTRLNFDSRTKSKNHPLNIHSSNAGEITINTNAFRGCLTNHARSGRSSRLKARTR
jgi:hypothetical protein